MLDNVIKFGRMWEIVSREGFCSLPDFMVRPHLSSMYQTGYYTVPFCYMSAIIILRADICEKFGKIIKKFQLYVVYCTDDTCCMFSLKGIIWFRTGSSPLT